MKKSLSNIELNVKLTITMSERITTQIRVIKNGNTGSSRIEVYP